MTLPIRRACAAAPLASLALALAGCGGVPEGPLLPGERPGSAVPEDARTRAESLARIGDTALRSGETETAASLFEQATILDAGNARAAVGLGDALLALGRGLDASRAFERALAAQPDSPVARYGCARAMLAIRRPEVASEFLRKLVAANPSDIASVNALGVSYDLLGDHATASETYRQGLTVVPGSAALRNNLAPSLALQDRFAESLDLIRPLAEGPDAIRRSRQNLALVYGLQGDLGAAERLGRVDLDATELRNNLAYFAAVRGLDDPTARAAALAPDGFAALAGPSPARPREAARRARPQHPVEPAAVPAPSSPPPAEPPSTGPRALTPAVGDFAAAEAAQRWRGLRAKHGMALAGLGKLAGAGAGLEPLLVGPVASEQAATSLCRQIGGDVATCRPLQL